MEALVLNETASLKWKKSASVVIQTQTHLKKLSNDKRYGGSHLHTPCSDIAILIGKCLPHKLRRMCLRFCHHNLILKLGNSQSDSEKDCTPCNQPSSSFQVQHIRHSQNSFQKVSTGTHQIEQKSHKMISNC